MVATGQPVGEIATGRPVREVKLIGTGQARSGAPVRRR
jgi:hypothetical protein